MTKRTGARVPLRRPRRFSRLVLDTVCGAKMVGLRSGTAHRFTGVWVVVVGQRVFVRSWNDEPPGWHRAFLAEPWGILKLVDREVLIRTRRVRSEALLEAVDQAYGEKYASRADLRWVQGLRLPRRRATTTELVPR